MLKKNKQSKRISTPQKERKDFFTCKSGLRVNIYDNTWKILPYKGKGHEVKVGWVHSNEIPDEDRILILEVLVFYAKNRRAGTTVTVCHNSKPFIENGLPSLSKLKGFWSNLKTSNKKGLNQFFSTLKKLGYSQFEEYHAYTSTRLDKETKNNLNPNKGALTDTEFDSLAKLVNNKIVDVNWSKEYDLAFYQSQIFSYLRISISNKMLLSIVRRPIQISMLKWSDVIPSGHSFNDRNIKHEDEIGTVGSKTLQLRIFKAKEQKVGESIRDVPERYPLHLHERFSRELMLYKNVYANGFRLLIESCDLQIDDHDLFQIMNNMPIFPTIEFFKKKFDSVKLIKSLFTQNSSVYHINEGLVSSPLSALQLASDRVADCKASSNRIRHTVLTRGAQDGLSSAQLAKITGVTEPAVRHYIDLDYSSRRLIDNNYIGNEFLKKAFNTPITEIIGEQEYIYDYKFNPVGGPKNTHSCTTCSTKMGKPLGCYGCLNFLPILEADHGEVLLAAERKRDANKKSLINPLYRRSIEKLEKQIELVKYTISLCNEILLKRSAIDAE